MEPELIRGDRIVVNKWIQGPRLFNIWEAMKGKKVCIYRLPGFGKVKRNDILVFNYPHPNSWERIEMHLLQYYIKRCIGLPGDSVIIQNGVYAVNGITQELGNRASQYQLSRQDANSFPPGVYHCFPFDSSVDWNILSFGPLYIPKKGDIIDLNYKNYLLYKQMIAWELQDSVGWKDDTAYVKNKPLKQYQFRSNYYFVAGDKTEDSRDSRYLGPIPEEYVVGVAWRILKSIDPYTGSYRKERFWKNIRNH